MLVRKQYEFVRESRQVLFDYCRTLSPTDFTNQNSSFGRGGSIRNLLVHIANTYEFWIAATALRKGIHFAPYDTHHSIADVVFLFEHVDGFMAEFMERLEQPEEEIIYEHYGEERAVTLLRLFTHVITHEYHHKGQILSLSRHLGYVPVDTDIMR